MQLIKKSLFLALTLAIFTAITSPVLAQVTQNISKPETFEAKVVKVIEEKYHKPLGSTKEQLYQKLLLKITSGKEISRTITVENGQFPSSNSKEYRVGDELVITHSKGNQGKDMYYIADYVRRKALLWLFALFVLIVVVVGKWYGLTALIGMDISFLVIFKYILPQIFLGKDPVTVAIVGSLMIVPATFYLSHGLNKKTTVAILGTIIALIISGFVADLFVSLTQLTGYSSEEANFIQTLSSNTINMKGLLLAGIIISGIGVFDDITISQASIVAELKKTSTKISRHELYRRAMNIGQDHIASVVNTLVLVYAGAALPLLVLFMNNPRPFAEVINYEFLAEEIVKTLVASIGLILAVPITTFLSTLAAEEEK